MMQAVIGVKFIADHMKQQEDENEVCIGNNFLPVIRDRPQCGGYSFDSTAVRLLCACQRSLSSQ